MRKTIKKRKHRSGKWNWKQFLKEKKYTIDLNGENTIDFVPAIELLNRSGEIDGLSQEQKQMKIDKFAKKLSGGRLGAINELIEGGVPLNILGEGRIYRISIDPQDREEHNRRLGRQLDQKKIGVAKKIHSLTLEKRKEFGLPNKNEINRTKRRLCLGNGQADIAVNQ